MANKKQTKTESKNKNLWHRKSFRIFAIVVAVIAMLAVALTVFTWAWDANYHKDDLRDRPIGKDFVYIGRDLRIPARRWSFVLFGLQGLSGSPHETFYYATDVPPDEFANKLQGNWHQQHERMTGCTAPVLHNCIDLDVQNSNSKGGHASYVSRQALLDASKTLGFPLKSDERKYYVGIDNYLMQYINPANIDPEVYKNLPGGSK